jgi:hypothetical protein
MANLHADVQRVLGSARAYDLILHEFLKILLKQWSVIFTALPV